MGLSPVQAKTLLEGDAINLAAKVKSGKPLTTAERGMLEGIAAGQKQEGQKPTFAKNIVELAKTIGVTRQTIHNWLKEDGNPGAASNGNYEVAKWIAWAKESGKELDDDGDGGTSQTAARAEQILLQNERLRHKIGEEKGRLIPIDSAKRLVGKLVLDLKARNFTSINRFVMLARMAPDSSEAAAEIRKEMIAIWKGVEDSKWVK